MRTVRNIGMRRKKIKRKLRTNNECMCAERCGRLQHVSANTGSYFFRLRLGLGGWGVQNIVAFVHTTAITQHPASTNRRYTSSTYQRYTVRRRN